MAGTVVFPSEVRDMLPMESLHLLLSVLSTHEENPPLNGWNKSASHVAYFAWGVLDTADHWFADDELGQIL
jgi:hypothetical protein